MRYVLAAMVAIPWVIVFSERSEKTLPKVLAYILVILTLTVLYIGGKFSQLESEIRGLREEQERAKKEVV